MQQVRRFGHPIRISIGLQAAYEVEGDLLPIDDKGAETVRSQQGGRQIDQVPFCLQFPQRELNRTLLPFSIMVSLPKETSHAEW